MNVGLFLQVRFFGRELKHGIGFDAADLFNHFGRGRVVADRVGGDSSLGPFGNRRRFAPDHRRPGGFQFGRDLTQVFGVLIDRDLNAVGLLQIGKLAIVADVFQVMKAEVEMDDVPVLIPQPLV